MRTMVMRLPAGLLRKLEHLTLRQRFLVAPLLGLLLLGTLLAAFIHESQRQNVLLTEIAERHLTALDRHSEIFVVLSTHHLALHALLTTAARMDGATLYARASAHLDAIHANIAQIDKLLAAHGGARIADAEFLGLLHQLPTLTEKYRLAVTHAVEMATADLSRTAALVVTADERFIAMNSGLARLMRMQRDALATEIDAGIVRSKAASGILTLLGLAGASLLLYLSLSLSRYLSQKLEAQVGILAELTESGPGEAPQTDDEVLRIGRAIESFRHTQIQLRESEERFRSLFERSHAVMLLIEPDSGAILAANTSAAEFYGHTRQHLATMTIGQINALPAVAGERREMRLDQRNYLVCRHRLADGQQRIVEVHATPVETAGKAVLFAIIHDITERKRTEEALRISEAALNDAQTVAKVGSWSLDLATNTLRWSAETYRIFGLPPDAPLSLESFLACIHPSDQNAVVASWHAALRGQPYDIEHRILVAGAVRWVRECANVRFDANGQACFGIGTVQDITELKHAQLALHELNRDLEKRVAQRTAQLEAASRAKSDFLANMSHEIRTPLNTVLGMAHLALRTDLPPRQRDYLEKIHASGQHLLELIDAILDFSKIEAGKLEIVPATFAFAALMQNVVSVCTSHAVVKGLPLRLDLDPAIATHLHGDPLRLSQVLINLTNNAVKFTERGEISVRVERLADDVPASCRLRFTVRDTGIGMTADEQARVFDAFQQADSSTTRKFGGTGLGLAISRQLVALMGGEIGVDSQVGAGSAFWFTVALGVATPAAGNIECACWSPASMRAVREKTAAALQAGTTLRHARILLADDHPFNQQVAKELLEDAGATLCIANNGIEVLDLLARERFDCVLMDVQMPEMDGLEATRQIRMQPTLNGMPVIALTANAWNQDRARCLAAGMDDFVSKPIQPELFYACIAQWVAHRRGQTPAGGAAPPTADQSFAGDPEVIDLAVPARALNYDIAKVHRVVTKFVEATRGDLLRLEAALQEGDLVQLGALGHRIKSPARAVGAAGLANLCQALEACREGGTAAQASAIVARVPALLERIASTVEAHRRQAENRNAAREA